jgi:FlaA1/EpsC-like NDP-sugar epimerase
MNLHRCTRFLWLTVVHFLVFAAAYALAILLRFDFKLPREQLRIMLAIAPWYFPLKLLAFYYMRSFHGWWRYVTFADLADLLKASGLATLLVASADYFVFANVHVPRGILILDLVTTILLFGGLRSFVRLFREHFIPMVRSSNARRALVVGASRSGETLVRLLRNEERWGYRAVGFIDEDVKLIGTRMGGLPILGTPNDVRPIAKRLEIEDVLVAAESLPGDVMRTLTEQCRRDGLRLRVMPSADELVRGVFRPVGRPVEIKDLLKREPVTLDEASIATLLRGKRVMVTGAGGSIGSEICRQVLNFSPDTVALVERFENNLFLIDREIRGLHNGDSIIPYVADILDETRMRRVFAEFRPEVIFHAAAHKHVPMMEMNPGEAIKNNLFGTKLVGDLAKEFGASHFVLISTDKAVNPTSVMGVAKQLAERCVYTANSDGSTRFMVVRFGNVLGSAGSVVPIFQEQIQNGGPVTVTHPDMQRYFMTIPEASQLVLQAAALGRGGEVFVLDMGQPVKILDLVHDMLYLSGLRPGDIEVKFTGIRPGEKLFEELRFDNEQVLPTSHPKVHVAYQRPYDNAEVRTMIDEMEEAIHAPELLSELLRRYVPEFVGKVNDHSPFRRHSEDVGVPIS